MNRSYKFKFCVQPIDLVDSANSPRRPERDIDEYDISKNNSINIDNINYNDNKGISPEIMTD